jgi:hypothetical protein
VREKTRARVGPTTMERLLAAKGRAGAPACSQGARPWLLCWASAKGTAPCSHGTKEGGRWGAGGLLLEEEEEGQGAPRHCWPRGGRALLLGASQRWKKGSAAMGGREFMRAEQRKKLCVRERGRRESGG